jgi:hypothetical protein
VAPRPARDAVFAFFIALFLALALAFALDRLVGQDGRRREERGLEEVAE